MADTNFTPRVTKIVSTWLQDVNDFVYRGVGLLASLVTFTPSGTAPTVGWASRTVQTRFSDCISLQDASGVDPTGATDSSAAIQSVANYCITNNRRLWVPKGDYLISSGIVTNGNLRMFGEGRNAGFVFDSALTGWGWTHTDSAQAFLAGASFDHIYFSVSGNSGSLAGMLRFSDVISPTLKDVVFNGAITAEALRFENSTRYCESIHLDRVRIAYCKYGVRFVPSTESVADRYSTVTTGTTSFNQAYLNDVQVQMQGPASGAAFRVNGNFARSTFVNCGGWPGSDSSYVYDIVTDPNGLVLVSPWADGTGGVTTAGLFNLEDYITEMTVINPQTGGLYFDKATTNFWHSKFFLGRLVKHSDSTEAVGALSGHLEASSTYTNEFDDFESLDTGKWTTTGTAALDTTSSFTHTLKITPTSGNSGVHTKTQFDPAQSTTRGYASWECRFQVDDLTNQLIYLGLVRDIAFNMPLSALRDAYVFTTESSLGSVDGHLYFVVMDDTAGTEKSRTDLGAIATSTWYVVKLIVDQVNTKVECFLNGTHQASVASVAQEKCITLMARNPGATTNLYVDYSRGSAARRGV